MYKNSNFSHNLYFIKRPKCGVSGEIQFPFKCRPWTLDNSGELSLGPRDFFFYCCQEKPDLAGKLETQMLVPKQYQMSLLRIIVRH